MPTDQWRHAVYSMWVFLGVAFIVLIFIPESPRYYAIKGKHDLARKAMEKIYGGVAGYDTEHEYAIILKEIEDGRILIKKQKDANLLDCFRGTNLVSFPLDFATLLTHTASNHHLGYSFHLSAMDWISCSLHLH